MNDYESAWSRHELKMDIYELADGTAVGRSRLSKFIGTNERDKTKPGRRLVYGPAAVRRVVKEWLTNPYWHSRSSAKQCDYLKLFLHSTAAHRLAQFKDDLRLLAGAVRAASLFDPAFPQWLDELRSAFPRTTAAASRPKPGEDLLDLLLGS